MGRKKTLKYKELLEFGSIRKYLKMAIGSKKTKITEDLTLEDKLKNIRLSAYLRGIVVFFEYSKLFNYPSEIMDYWKENRDNESKIELIYEEITLFPNWIKKVKKLSDTTAVNYQSNIRGFLTNNNINIKFKNIKPKTEKEREQNKLGINYNEFKNFAMKVKNYIPNFNLRFFVEFLHRTGLSQREIVDLTFGVLRAKDYKNQDYIMISDDREKSTVAYCNFISPDLKDEYLLDFLKKNKDMSDNEKIFGNNTEYVLHKFDLAFTTAYRKCCENHFKRYLAIKTRKGNLKKVFSLHSFRSVFISACQKLRIPEKHENLFVAHKSTKMTNYDLNSDDELLTDYKLVENELFGSKKTNKIAIVDDVFDVLKEIVLNKGKRKAIMRKYQENPKIDITTEIRGILFLEQFKLNIKKELKNELIQEVKIEMDKIKNNFLTNFNLKDLLLSLK